MPSGYTADLYEGKEVDFPTFALKCARAFGALVEMRDDPLDAPIPPAFWPSDYNLEELAKATRQLKEALVMDKQTATRKMQEYYQEVRLKHRESIAEGRARKKRYEAMRAKVRRWIPPTPEHQGLKEHMIQQLDEGIKFDCGYKIQPPRRLSGSKYKQQLIESALSDIEYHRREHEADLRRAKGRTDWVYELRKSLQSLS